MGLRNFSLLEAIEVAVNMEEEGIRFYTLAEERAGDPESKQLFALLREREHDHIVVFRRLYSELARREGDQEAELYLLDPEISAYFRAYVESTVFPVKGAAEKAVEQTGGAADILRLALRIEKDSILYYQELATHSPYPGARDLLEKVIAEERKHFMFIQERLAKLSA